MKTGLCSKILVFTEILISVAVLIMTLLMAIGMIGSAYWPIVVVLLTIFIVLLAILAIFDIKRNKVKRKFHIIYILPTIIYIVIMSVIYFI